MMCGFVGYLLKRGIEQPDLGEWSACLAHRGPDQAGQAVDRTFGIGTRRLSILDRSAAGNQPMCSDRYILGFNGEIFNHLEIRTALQHEGVGPFSSHCDTETVLRAIERWGIPATLRRLNGMYALAVWDRARAELTLARDPLGIKPLLYITMPTGCYFGSELKALRRFAAGRISPAGLALYLLLGFVPAPYSMLDGVQKVRAGEAVTFGRGGVKRDRIIPDGWSRRQWVAAAYRDRVEQVRWAVVGAVERQLLADVPIGLFLSGGVDSSILATVASARDPNLTSFSIRPGETLADPGAQQDAALAAALAAALGIPHCELVIEPGDLLGELDDLMARIDEPVAELYVTAEVLLSRLARRVGVPVVLTGHGGDEVFMGYPTYQAVQRGDRYNRIPWFGAAMRGLARVPWLPPTTRGNVRGAADVWRKPPLARYVAVSTVHFSPEEVAAMADLPLASVHELITSVVGDAWAAVTDLPASRPLTTAELFARLDLRLKVPEHYNMRLDRATMAASIEARVPFQDLDLIGFVMQLPDDDLLHGGAKGLLKDAFADVVPAAVRQRPKQTFQAPMLSWLRGPLGPWVETRIACLPGPLGKMIATADLPPRSTWQAYRAWCLALLESWRDSNHLEY